LHIHEIYLSNDGSARRGGEQEAPGVGGGPWDGVAENDLHIRPDVEDGEAAAPGLAPRDRQGTMAAAERPPRPGRGGGQGGGPAGRRSATGTGDGGADAAAGTGARGAAAGAAPTA